MAYLSNLTPLDLQAGDPTKIHSFGHWYLATVREVSPKRALVVYTTGSGKERTVWVPRPTADRPYVEDKG